MVRAAQFIDYADPPVAQRKHGVGGEMPPYYFFRKKQRTIKNKKAVAQRSRIGKM